MPASYTSSHGTPSPRTPHYYTRPPPRGPPVDPLWLHPFHTPLWIPCGPHVDPLSNPSGCTPSAPPCGPLVDHPQEPPCLDILWLNAPPMEPLRLDPYWTSKLDPGV